MRAAIKRCFRHTKHYKSHVPKGAMTHCNEGERTPNLNTIVGGITIPHEPTGESSFARGCIWYQWFTNCTPTRKLQASGLMSLEPR